MRRFCSLERKFNAKPELKAEYSRVMLEYINSNHKTLVSDKRGIGEYYLLHQIYISNFSLNIVINKIDKASNEFVNY